MFLWMMPRPPSCAMAMARRASVTVSIAAETQRNIERDRARKAGLQGNVARNDEGMGGNQQDVVEGQRFPDDTH